MKKILTILVLSALLFSVTMFGIADQFFVSVNIPASTGANFIVYKIVGGIFPTTPINTVNLGFTVTLKTVNAAGDKAFLANEYYAINVDPNGVGLVNLKLNYIDTSWPTGQTNKLGVKGVASVAAVDPTNPLNESQLFQKSFIGSDNQTILASSVPAGKYMRVYVALANGTEPASVGVTPFNPADKSGLYEGTLTLTALQP